MHKKKCILKIRESISIRYFLLPVTQRVNPHDSFYKYKDFEPLILSQKVLKSKQNNEFPKQQSINKCENNKAADNAHGNRLGKFSIYAHILCIAIEDFPDLRLINPEGKLYYPYGPTQDFLIGLIRNRRLL